MTDHELLELAAKAAGYDFAWYCEGGNNPHGKPNVPFANGHRWNPLIDDGDAFRLAVKLCIPIFPYNDETSTGTVGVVAKNWGTKEANTRRAIVRAAAEIGKDKQFTVNM